MEKSVGTPENLALVALLRELREARGLSQRRLSALLDSPPAFVSKVEDEEVRLDVIQLWRYLAPLGVTLPEFAERLQARLDRLPAETETPGTDSG